MITRQEADYCIGLVMAGGYQPSITLTEAILDLGDEYATQDYVLAYLARAVEVLLAQGGQLEALLARDTQISQNEAA